MRRKWMRIAGLGAGLALAILTMIWTAPAKAQDPISMDNDKCGSPPNGKQWPTMPTGTPALRQRDTTDAQKDHSTASSFEVWREFAPSGHAELFVCYANIHIQPSKSGTGLHLLVTLPEELPKGKTLGDFVKDVDVSGREAKIYIKVPKRLHASILLEVPAQTGFEIGLGRGTVEIAGIRGDKEIGVGSGTVSVHMLPDEYSRIGAGFAFGGVKDQRLGKNHTRILGGFEQEGKGKYKLDVGMAFGHLILLPEKSSN